MTQEPIQNTIRYTVRDIVKYPCRQDPISIIVLLTAIIQCHMPIQGDATFLPNRWTMGIVVDDHTVDPPKRYRGGRTILEIKEDNEVRFSGPFSCGIGLYKLGKWSYDPTNNELTFHFSDLKSLMNSNKDEKIDECVTYAVIYSSKTSLILQPRGDKEAETLGFLIMP